MKYCELRPWYEIELDIQDIIKAIGRMLLVLYGTGTAGIGIVAWVMFFDPNMSVDIPIWIEFIRLSWYFWVPVVILKVLHTLLCVKKVKE